MGALVDSGHVDTVTFARSTGPTTTGPTTTGPTTTGPDRVSPFSLPRFGRCTHSEVTHRYGAHAVVGRAAGASHRHRNPGRRRGRRAGLADGHRRRRLTDAPDQRQRRGPDGFPGEPDLPGPGPQRQPRPHTVPPRPPRLHRVEPTRWGRHLHHHLERDLRRHGEHARDRLAERGAGARRLPAGLVRLAGRRLQRARRGAQRQRLPGQLLRPVGGQILAERGVVVVDRPPGREPHGDLRGHGAFRLLARRQPRPGPLGEHARRPAGSGHRDVPARRLRLRHPRGERRLPPLGQRLRPDLRPHRDDHALGVRLARHGGKQRPDRVRHRLLLPGPGGAGARRDDLRGRPAHDPHRHQPAGLPRGDDQLGRGAPLRDVGALPRGQHPLLRQRAAVRHLGRRHLVRLAGIGRHLPRRDALAPEQPRVGRRPVDPGNGQLLPPGDDASGERRLRAVVGRRRDARAAVVLRRDRVVARRRDDAGTTHGHAPDHRLGPRLGRAPPAVGRPGSRPVPGPGHPLRHLDVPSDGTRDHVHALHRGRTWGHARPLLAPRWHRGRRTGRPARRRPQRPARPERLAGGLDRLADLPARLLGVQPDGGRLRPVRHDVRRGPPVLLPSSRARREGPRHLLGPDERWRCHLQRPRRQRLVGGRHRLPRRLLRTPTLRLHVVRARDRLGTVERVQQHRVGRRGRLRRPGARALLHRREVGGAVGHRRRRHHAQHPDLVVAGPDRRRRPALHGRGCRPSLHGEQRLVRGGRHPRPGRPARAHAPRHAAVVHRGGLVEQRQLRLPPPGRRRGPGDGLAEGARHPRVELLLRRRQLGQRRRHVLADPDGQR